LRKFSILGLILFLSSFLYFYRESGKFRQSIKAAIVATFILSSCPSESRAKGVDGFTPQPPQHQSSRKALSSGASSSNGPGKPNNGGPGGGGDDDNGLPQYPHVESVEETQHRLDRLEESLRKMEESSDSESEEEQCEAEEKTTKIGTAVVKVNSDKKGNPIVTIEKKNGKKIVCTYYSALRKYYHADVHGLEFPEGFDKNHARNLTPNNRKAYIESTVPREKILEFLKANVRSLSSDSFQEVPGFIGSRKEPGTIYFNRNTRELHFVNEGMAYYSCSNKRSIGKIS